VPGDDNKLRPVNIRVVVGLLAVAGVVGAILAMRERSKNDPRTPGCWASSSAAWAAFAKDDFDGARARLAGIDRDCSGAIGDDNVRLRKALDAKDALSASALREAAAASASASALAAEDAKREAEHAKRLADWKRPPWLETVVSISKDPKALTPVDVTPPAMGPHTTYDYKIPKVGKVILRWLTSSRWSVFFPEGTAANASDFAPPLARREVYKVGPATCWRVEAGPFRGDFVLEVPGGVEVLSAAEACSGPLGPPGLTKECGR
jgi:hypothetical protein